MVVVPVPLVSAPPIFVAPAIVAPLAVIPAPPATFVIPTVMITAITSPVPIPVAAMLPILVAIADLLEEVAIALRNAQGGRSGGRGHCGLSERQSAKRERRDEQLIHGFLPMMVILPEHPVPPIVPHFPGFSRPTVSLR